MQGAPVSMDKTDEYKKDIAVVLAEIIKKQAQKEAEMKDLDSKIDSLTELWQKRIRKYQEEIKKLKAQKNTPKVSNKACILFQSFVCIIETSLPQICALQEVKKWEILG